MSTSISPATTPDPCPSGEYRVDFALITIAGNRTRYETVRPLIEREGRLVTRWFPIRTWVQDDWLRVLHPRVRVRLRHLLDSWRFLIAAPDAAVIHAFETHAIYMGLRSLRRSSTAVVVWSDGPVDPARQGLLGLPRRHAIATTDLFLLFSKYAADVLIENYPNLDSSRVLVLHPGLNLDTWPFQEGRVHDGKFRLLFVGGEAERKGLDVLVSAFESHLHETCSLRVVTQSGFLPPALRARIERQPGIELDLDVRAAWRDYTSADAFVLPTNWDLSPWVLLEAMASGTAVISTPVGGIPEIVTDGVTGLTVPQRSPDALAHSIDTLRSNGELRQRLARQARRHVERQFDAKRQTVELSERIVTLVDSRRSLLSRQRA